MDWLRAGTPDPFGDPETYFRRYQRGTMPRASYTVMSWWDYGYWILRAGRRVPASTPSQLGAADAGRFFTATTEAEATAVMARNQARYVVADSGLALQRTSDGSAFVGKFDAVALWAGRQPSEFYDTVWSRRPDGSLGSIVVFFPDYYRSMAFRLSRPDPGAAEAPRSVWVISYEDRRNPSGEPIREVVRSTEFAGYAEAVAHLARLGPGPHLLVGLDPAHTCVPLEPLRSFELLAEVCDALARD